MNSRLALILVFIALVAGGFYIYHQQTTESVSLSIGGNEVSATVSE